MSAELKTLLKEASGSVYQGQTSEKPEPSPAAVPVAKRPKPPTNLFRASGANPLKIND